MGQRLRLRSRRSGHFTRLAEILVIVLVAVLAGVTLLVSVLSRQSGGRSYRLGADGTTAVVDSYAKAIRETVWVDIGRDDDEDGIVDRVAVDIIRPIEAARAQQRVPVIMESSGYYGTEGRGNEMQDKAYNSEGRPTRFPLFTDNYFVPRGYAVALVDLAGTNRSTGCPDYGGPSELASSTRVIDWLNGRAPGYTAAKGGKRASASWSSGRVGMIGKSWDGQNVIETSVTGIRGLDAVVPESAPTSDWTDFLDRTGTNVYQADTWSYTDPFVNATGAALSHCRAVQAKVRAGEPDNGDFTSEWASRDWSSRAASVRAAVLMVQGQNDGVVAPFNVGPYWTGLPKSLPKKLWLSETGHVDPFDFRRAVWVDTLHRWFDRYLYNIHNGIEHTSQLSVERSPDRWVDYPAFPATNVRQQVLYADTAGATTSLSPTPNAEGAVESTTSDSTVNLLSPTLTTPLRISGTPHASVTVSTFTRETTGTSVDDTVRVEIELYDVGAATIRGNSLRAEAGILNPKTTTSCWGQSTPSDSACYYNTPPDIATVKQVLLGYGARNLFHSSSVTQVQNVVPNRQYTLSIPTWTMDRILPAGHRLELQINTSGPTGSVTTLHLNATSLTVPTVTD